MDKIDIRLIRELIQGRAGNVFRRELRLPYKSLADRLGIPETTARERVEKILKSGFLPGGTLLVNPSLLEVNLLALGFDVPPSISKEDLTDKLSLLPDVLTIISYHGSHIGMVFIYLDEADLTRKVHLISKLSAMQDSYSTRIPFPPCEISLSRTDWRIVASMQTNMRRSYREIAGDLRLSPRTVKRRLTKMLTHRAIFILVSEDPKKLLGGVLADFIVFYEAEVTRVENEAEVIRGLLDDYVIVTGRWPNFSVYNTIVPNLPEATRLYDAIRRHPGVRSVRLELVAERIEHYKILKEQVARKLARVLVAA